MTLNNARFRKTALEKAEGLFRVAKRHSKDLNFFLERRTPILNRGSVSTAPENHN